MAGDIHGSIAHPGGGDCIEGPVAVMMARIVFRWSLELPDLVNTTEGAEFELAGAGVAWGKGRNIRECRGMARGPDYFWGL